MESFSRDFVYEKFCSFYRDSSTVIPAPAVINQREFGFLLFKGRVMMRHESVATTSDLKPFLGEIVPSDAYHSCAYYENPEADMDKKGWLGADLVFDIDADHIPTSCDKIHDEWSCTNPKCMFSGKGITPESCPVCGGQKFDAKSWPCERCIDSAKEETVKLVDILEKDFGFSDRELRVFFSGHRGYHVHVEAEDVKLLDAMARKEIVDYVYGLGLALFDEEQKENRKNRKGSQVFSLHDFGWNKRIKQGIRSFVLKATKEDLKNIGIKQNVEAVLKNKEAIAKQCMEENQCTGVRGVGTETWMKIAKHVKGVESAKIDTVVTTDIHRLIRMNGTLHGKTGLKKVEFPLTALSDFDPFREAVAFKKGTVRVFVSSAPEFRLGENVFGPFKNKTAELSTAAAVLLVLKGRAEVVKE